MRYFIFIILILFIFLSSVSANNNDELQNKCKELLKGKNGTIIVMDVNNGKVLSLVNPKLAVSCAFSPGSIFKIITAVALLETGTVDINKTVYCENHISIYGKDYKCWQKEGHKNVNIVSAISHSCNIYFFTTAKELQPELLLKYAYNFRIGQPTYINVSDEVSGELPKSLTQDEKIKMSVGLAENLYVTPIQMAVLISAIANGGTFYRPYIPESDTTSIKPTILSTIPYNRSLSIVKEGMRDAVNFGSARRADSKKIKIAGKTGTATSPGEWKTYGWFIGYAPFDNPQIAVVVFLVSGSGYDDCAPIAKEIFDFLF